jgi:glycosyltransferase involved in cell wall biosynthesis
MFLLDLLRHAFQGWTIHVHTNGHNVKSWFVALAGGMAGRMGPGCRLTLHSGRLPAFLEDAQSHRWLAAFTCFWFTRIICVSPRLQSAIETLGVQRRRIEVAPAFQGIVETSSRSAASPHVEKWLARHWPVFSATALDSPEYGIEVLVDAISRLSSERQGVGCLLMGVSPEAEAAVRLIEQRRLTRSILMLGDVSHAECLHLMSRSTAFIRPTLTDGDSVSVREALALGVPVVASDAVTRPEGTILFATGNADDLMSKLECVIAGNLSDSAQ